MNSFFMDLWEKAGCPEDEKGNVVIPNLNENKLRKESCQSQQSYSAKVAQVNQPASETLIPRIRS
jgi:hypothetical protein